MTKIALLWRANHYTLIASTATMLGAGALRAQTTTHAVDGVLIERNVGFLAPGRVEKADLYLPATTPPGKLRPAVVIIHGGGWTGSQRDASREVNIGTNLALHGYVGMSIDYLLATTNRASWPQNLYDCKTAVRWLRNEAGRLQIDPNRIGVIGGSAGGHLAAMVALTTPRDGLDPKEPYGSFSCQVRCCVDLYGVADLTKSHDISMLGKTLADAPELYRAASPVTYVRRHSPPMLILHGTADTTVSQKQSELLADALQKAGVEHQLVIIPDAPHSFDLQPKQRDLRPIVLGFFDKYLKHGMEP
jgi:acetyl esterase/lipase